MANDDTLQGAEILFGFVGWLTSRPEPITMSGKHNATEACNLIKRFCEANGMSEDCRPHWDRKLTHPPVVDGEATSFEAVKGDSVPASPGQTLEELIQQQEYVQELATEGKWRVVPAGLDASGADTYDIEAFGVGTTDRPLATGMWSQDARATVIRHNTAEEVLQALKRLDEAETKARVCPEDADSNATRAEKAEAKGAELREENAGLLAAADADAFTIGNLNARVALVEAKVMELGTEVARLTAGWHEANGRALEVGLERTNLEARVEVLEFDQPQALNQDTHPWPQDGSEFEVIFRRPESKIVRYVAYEKRWLTVDNYAIEGDVEGWRPLTESVPEATNDS